MTELGSHTAVPGEEGHLRPSGPLARVVALLEATGSLIAGSCLLVMFVALLVNVVLRYLFGTGIPWAYEIHAILFPWAVAGGVVIASAQGRNIAITILPDMLPPAGKRAVLIAIDVAVLVISVSVLWSSQPIILASRFQTLSTLGVAQIWGYLSLVYAFGLMAVLALLDAISLVVWKSAATSGDAAPKSLS
jgi:TRAP-type transport system small permease protein